MAPFLDFVKRQMFFILCAIGALAGIALMVTGLGAMPKVGKALAETKATYEGLAKLQPMNESFIEAEKKRIEALSKNRDVVFSQAMQLQNYSPLLEGVFPDGNTDKRVEFRDKYEAAMKALLASMNAGDVAGSREETFWEEKIKSEEHRRLMAQKDPSVVAPPPLGEKSTPAGVITADGVRDSKESRASIARAQQIRIYAIDPSDAKPPDRVSSLDFHPPMKKKESLEAPAIDDCWWAQVGYWIQKDVVDAIASLNGEVANALLDKGEDPWVGVMPIKCLVSVRVQDGYLGGELDATASEGEPGGFTEAKPLGNPEKTITGTSSTESYEAIQFTVKLVADQRQILRFVEKLCSNRFHTCLRISYKAVPPNKQMRGRVFGSQPVVNAVLDFETVFIGVGAGEGDEAFTMFRRMMPLVVCDKYAVTCPEPAEDAGKTEGG